MAENRPLPRTFGQYQLTRSLGRDPLGETLRAGTFDGPGLAPFVLVRVFDGDSVDRAALVPSMETAVEHLDEFRGQAVAKGTVLGIVDDVPYTGIDYVPGLTLDRILAGTPAGQAAFTPENALLVGERLLAGLEAGYPFIGPTGAPHGFLVPAFVTVSGDGDTRLFGAGLGPALLGTLASAPARKAFGPYIAPEVAASGNPSPAGDVYSAGAIVLAAAAGRAPEPGRAAEAVASSPFPDDARALLLRMVDADPSRRESEPSAVRRALGRILHAGAQASTFTLAFAVSQRFARVLDDDRRAMSEEERIDAKAIAAAEERAASRAGAPADTPATPEAPRFEAPLPSDVPAAKGRGLPVPAIVAALAVLAGGGALVVKMASRREASVPPPPPPTPVAVLPAAVPSPPPTPAPMVVGKEDPEFRAAVEQQLALEVKKLQDQLSREQRDATKRQQAELDRAAEEARKAQAALAAARERADSEEATRLAKAAAEARQREEAARKAAEDAARTSPTGDPSDTEQVEKPATAVRIVRPEPTLLARQRKVSGTVLARVLVNEKGGVDAVEILRDTNPAVGLADATREALKRWEWSPATKDGKPVKSWIAVPVPFR